MPLTRRELLRGAAGFGLAAASGTLLSSCGRVREAGLMDATPEQILQRGTDFRYLAQLRKELQRA